MGQGKGIRTVFYKLAGPARFKGGVRKIWIKPRILNSLTFLLVIPKETYILA